MAHRVVRTTSTPSSRLGNASTPRADMPQARALANDSVVAPHLVLALFAADDVEKFIDATFNVLQSAVACDFASAFYQSAGTGLFKERDSLGREYEGAFMRRYVQLTPALPIALANRGVAVLTTRGILPRTNDLRRTAFYREIMKPQSWRHAISLCFWGDAVAESPVFVVSTYRREGRCDFSPQEVGRVAQVHSFLDCAINRLYEREKAKTLRDSLELAVRDETRGVAVLDCDLRLSQANTVARAFLTEWNQDAAPGAVGQSFVCVPPLLLDACRDLRHEWHLLLREGHDVNGIRRRRCVQHPGAVGLTASITMVGPAMTGLGEPTFVIEIDRRVQRLELERANRSTPILQKMTPAERAVAMVLMDGLSNQEIADQLGKTVNAVKFLLHRIYQKTGVPNRAALVAALRSRQR